MIKMVQELHKTIAAGQDTWQVDSAIKWIMKSVCDHDLWG